MLIQLSDRVWIAAEEVLGVEVESENNRLRVRVKDGTSHLVGADYGSGIYATADRLIGNINAAKEKIHGTE